MQQSQLYQREQRPKLLEDNYGLIRMKKIFFVLCGIAFVSLTAFAMKSSRMPQFIITDCGTLHQIDSNASGDQAAHELDKWTAIDCANQE